MTTTRTAAVPTKFWEKHNSDRTQERLVRAESGQTPWCAACGATLNPERAATVHIIAGGARVLHPDDEALYAEDGGDMGCWDLGSECVKMIPAAFRAPFASL